MSYMYVVNIFIVVLITSLMRDQEHITPIDQYVIDFVRDLRTERNLTQDGLSSIIGISRSYISDIESTNSRAKYNLKHINSLADYFGMSPRDFLPEKSLPNKFKLRKKDEGKKALSKLKAKTGRKIKS